MSSCALCRFSHRREVDGHELFECRRRAPAPYWLKRDVRVNDLPRPRWPQVWGTDWCGQFEALP